MATLEDDVVAIIPKLFTAMTAENSPFKEALSFVESERLARILDQDQYVKLASSIFTGIINESNKTALLSAIDIAKHNEISDLSIESLEQDIAMKKIDKAKNYGATLNTDGTITYETDEAKLMLTTHYLKMLQMQKEIELTTTQEKSLADQTEDNRIIKNMSELAEYVQAIAQADLIPSAEFHTNFLIQQKALLLRTGYIIDNTTGEVSIDINGTPTIIGTFKIDASATTA